MIPCSHTHTHTHLNNTLRVCFTKLFYTLLFNDVNKNLVLVMLPHCVDPVKFWPIFSINVTEFHEGVSNVFLSGMDI